MTISSRQDFLSIAASSSTPTGRGVFSDEALGAPADMSGV
jgi:hypothetical protein